MNTQLLQQFRSEAEAWKQLLGFLQSENAYLKTCIAEIAGQDIPDELLPEIENFQNRSIAKDQIINVGKEYVSNYKNLIQDQFTQRNNHSEKIFLTQRNLKEYIETIERNFYTLKTDFNKCLAKL